MRGDSDDTGSWKTIWIFVRRVRKAAPSAANTSIGPSLLLKKPSRYPASPPA